MIDDRLHSVAPRTPISRPSIESSVGPRAAFVSATASPGSTLPWAGSPRSRSISRRPTLSAAPSPRSRDRSWASARDGSAMASGSWRRSSSIPTIRDRGSVGACSTLPRRMLRLVGSPSQTRSNPFRTPVRSLWPHPHDPAAPVRRGGVHRNAARVWSRAPHGPGIDDARSCRLRLRAADRSRVLVASAPLHGLATRRCARGVRVSGADGVHRAACRTRLVGRGGRPGAQSWRVPGRPRS